MAKKLGDNISEQVNGAPSIQKMTDAQPAESTEVEAFSDDAFLAQLKGLLAKLPPERKAQLISDMSGGVVFAPAPQVASTPKRIRIRLEENENIPPTGLFIGHNGRTFIIQTGRDVDVPPELLEVLDNAIMTSSVVNPDTLRVMGYRDKLRYPYRIIREPERA